MSVAERAADVAVARVVSGDGVGASAPIDDDGITVGRDPGCGLVLGDRSVAPRHLHLKPLPSGAVLLNDLDMERGTWVDDQRVTCAVLTGGERVRIGSTVLDVETIEQPSPTAPAVPRDRPIVPVHSPSMIERIKLRRSVKRLTVLAGLAFVGVVIAGIVILTGRAGAPTSEERVAALVDVATPSTVLIQAQRGDARSGSGTGWVLDAASGLLVTNAHVLNAGERFTVGVGSSLRRASVVGVSTCEDLAVLRVADTAGLRSLPLGDGSTVRQGQTAVAVGYPGNASLSDELTFTRGVVSVADVAYRESALDVPNLPSVLQTDAAINPGNSGGPLLNLDGRVIGVSSAGRTLNSSGRIIQGQSYAIGVDRVRSVVQGLRRGDSQGWYGLGFRYLSAQQLRDRDLPAGLLVNTVVEGSAADRAGVPAGQLLITAIDGRPVSNSLRGYCDAVSEIPSGAPVRVSALDIRTRARQTLTLR
jgi:S1-C subfamily serine protease